MFSDFLLISLGNSIILIVSTLDNHMSSVIKDIYKIHNSTLIAIQGKDYRIKDTNLWLVTKQGIFKKLLNIISIQSLPMERLIFVHIAPMGVIQADNK